VAFRLRADPRWCAPRTWFGSEAYVDGGRARVSRGTVTPDVWTALVANATEEIVDGVEALGGVARLDQAAAKVEIPSFGADIFDPGSADGEAAIAVEVCTAQPAAFDATEEPRTRAG
jgi:hypothetical protein